MANDAQVPAPPTQARTPRGINHLVLNVRDIETSHRFWTDVMGFRCVAELKQVPGPVRPKMRFYSGLDAHGDVTHHDLALAEVPGGGESARRAETWSLMRRRWASTTWRSRGPIGNRGCSSSRSCRPRACRSTGASTMA